MKKIMSFFTLVILFLLLFIQSVSAITFGNIINILENTESGEIKYIEKLLPAGAGNIIQTKIDDYSYKNWERKSPFKNWKGKCYYADTREINSSGNCEDLDNFESLEKITFIDLQLADKIKIFSTILLEFGFYLLIGIPFNFFVFFGLIYILYGKSINLLRYLLLSIIFTIILDIILIIFNFSLMQLAPLLFGAVAYGVVVFLPKIILAIYGIAKFIDYKYLNKKKGKKELKI